MTSCYCLTVLTEFVFLISKNVPLARKELSNFTLHRTPSGKIRCIKKTVAALVKPRGSKCSQYSFGLVCIITNIMQFSFTHLLYHLTYLYYKLILHLIFTDTITVFTESDEYLALTTDDLLPILVFLVIKADVTNW